ncbi:MAG TPA: SGNH/GDSL hydrolase family protein [Thiobacillaceae bacterium]|nr:SGNH/GDSL hydrolase family protein [Thiobacillaceae bacterium]
MSTPRISVTALALTALFVSSAASATITHMVVFGDSLSDSGNLYNITGGAIPPSPPYDQRFSNGPVAVEYLASDLGVPLTPSTVGGTNFAVAGAATGFIATPGKPGGPYDSYVAYTAAPILNGQTGIEAQVSGYTASSPSGLANTLFVLWGGTNDTYIITDPLSGIANPVLAMGNAVFNLSAEINALIGVGATRFLIPNMPDLSLTPEAQLLSPVDRASLSLLTNYFNGTLAAALLAIEAGNPTADIVGFDTNALFKEVYNNAAAYGFTQITTDCIDVGPSCYTNPVLADQYMFWDHVHPSTRLSQILGNAFAAAVPEPDSGLLFLAGLMPMILARRLVARRKARTAA